jgi:ribosomal protein L37AE/L43A
MITCEKKVPRLTQEPETYKKRKTNNITELTPFANVTENAIGVIPFNETTRSFYGFLLKEAVEAVNEDRKNRPTCPTCNQAIFTATIYKNGYYQDYSECRECGWNSLKETPQFTPENIEEELLKVPFENCEEVISYE